MTARSFTVVVPAHGPAGQVQPLLDELGRQAANRPVRVVLSDDASPVSLADGVRAPDGVELEVVRSERNGGPGAARNRGLERVATPWVAFLDADTVPAEGWLGRVDALVADPATADLVEGRTRIPADRPPTPFTHATEPADEDQHVAGNVVVRTRVLREVGGFDERFFDPRRGVHFREDGELAFRLGDAGVRSAHDAGLVVEHPPLPSSWWTPVRLARRYYFDPLIDREHPEAFRAMNARRRLGPVTLRRARHDASVLVVAGVLVVAVGLLGGWRWVAAVGAVAALAGWAATVVALAWKRHVGPRHVAPLLVVAAVVPWTYLWAWWRGVVRFRHRPRL